MLHEPQLAAPSFLRIMTRRLRKVAARVKRSYLDRSEMNQLLGSDPFLRGTKGVVHVGANDGRERYLYAKYHLKVAWIEPVPEVFSKLKANLNDFVNQHAFQYLVTDRNDAEYTFHVASNGGASSSILELGLHRDIWPDVVYEREITLRSVTLPFLLSTEHLNGADYDVLVLDTQGSELLVLQGAITSLPMFQYIKLEVADFEAYQGCCQIADVTQFMTQHGFHEMTRHQSATHEGGGAYYDIVFRRRTEG